MKTTKNLLLFFIVFTFIGCSEDKNEPAEKIKFLHSSAYSIIKNNDKLLLSGIVVTDNKKFITKYWIDSLSVDSITFINSFNNGIIYNVSNVPDNNLSRIIYVHRTLNGEKDIYKFDLGFFENDKKIFYYKNNDIIRMDTSALGTITSVSIFNDKPYFAGYFSEITYGEEGKGVSPKTPFFWDGNSILIDLPLPNVLFPNFLFFRGISCIYVDEEDYYIGGLMDFPMYWKNTEVIKLNTLYGEVNQIIKSGSDVYAVGFYNKNNSNSTGHTACFWKNGELFELADDAKASGIYIDGKDIYVSGSIGKVPIEYKACYWKNGVRVDLPN